MEVKEASWGKWSPWSHCKPPVNCRGHGTRTRHRFCLQDPQKPMLICRVSKGVSDLEMRMDNFALQALDLAKNYCFDLYFAKMYHSSRVFQKDLKVPKKPELKCLVIQYATNSNEEN